MTDKNSQLWQEAKKIIAGGVNSPVRSFKSVGGNPLFITRAKGSKIYDANNKEYLDYVGSWGPMILGHCDCDVTDAIKKQADLGLSFGAPTELETKLAHQISSMIPSIEKIRFVSSGTEATMSAIRLARGFNNREQIVKFTGCYHGHSDSLLSEAGSGLLTLGKIKSKPSSAGVPIDIIKHTKVLEYNHIEQLETYFKNEGHKTACVIIEPVAANMNLIPASRQFITKLRELCTQYGAVLIFDEVMSGFRVHPKGASGIYGVIPDLITLGKVIGGGMPVGAFGGKAEIMKSLAPEGLVYQAGTLSGNPISMIAGLTTLQKINQVGFFETINQKTERLINGLNQAAQKTSAPFYALSLGSLFGLFFTAQFSKENPIQKFAELSSCNSEHFKKFFHLMLENGVYFAPSSYEAGFVSIAHSDEDIDKTIHLAEKVFGQLN